MGLNLITVTVAIALIGLALVLYWVLRGPDEDNRGD